MYFNLISKSKIIRILKRENCKQYLNVYVIDGYFAKHEETETS